ncbi:hypothetical protein TCAL_03783 [Tigriopus californicus]|uniref:Saposin B-type domain-containing protein n=1 Tax=Tigriopus californicus TaxID=6832 RepID=A0A553NVA8_TIGCA|nr:uncharacterized protein LOC131887385 [Tigriopus californicus]TRY69371.1 hypothetical protein TCAL_03783 [Tigriopus californicus]|eukprot:TCALIF_03783-PA protein Name:"Similar to Psap Sulfated glycoprotein 1 (Rattus norvegicus)" AED:0.00 eAED:0.00 QI:93/1/1/1/1/1/2/39/126
MKQTLALFSLVALAFSCVAVAKTIHAPKSEDVVLCGICRVIVTEIDNFLTSDQTEDDVIEFVEQVCNIFEGVSHGIAQTCKVFIEENGPAIIENLVNDNLSPDEICIDALELCDPVVNTTIIAVGY